MWKSISAIVEGLIVGMFKGYKVLKTNNNVAVTVPASDKTQRRVKKLRKEVKKRTSKNIPRGRGWLRRADHSSIYNTPIDREIGYDDDEPTISKHAIDEVSTMPSHETRVAKMRAKLKKQRGEK